MTSLKPSMLKSGQELTFTFGKKLDFCEVAHFVRVTKY